MHQYQFPRLFREWHYTRLCAETTAEAVNTCYVTAKSCSLHGPVNIHLTLDDAIASPATCTSSPDTSSLGHIFRSSDRSAQLCRFTDVPLYGGGRSILLAAAIQQTSRRSPVRWERRSFDGLPSVLALNRSAWGVAAQNGSRPSSQDLCD
jgi:hypothetical protein